MQSLIYYFPLFFIVGGISICYIISKMGWTDLAAKYETSPEFIGTKIGLISANINSANYKNSLILKYNDEGIFLRPIFLFRLFHKPILIPWQEIKSIRTKKNFFSSYNELLIGSPYVATITISNSIFQRLEYKLSHN